MRALLIYILYYLSKLPFLGDLFKTLLAASAVGDGSVAMNEKSYDRAFKILKRFEYDDIDYVWIATCQQMLGNMYLNGMGVSKDESRAVAIFQRAASAGNDEAITFMRQWNAKQRSLHSNQGS